jgi:hypothetical protein
VPEPDQTLKPRENLMLRLIAREPSYIPTA